MGTFEGYGTETELSETSHGISVSRYNLWEHYEARKMLIKQISLKDGGKGLGRQHGEKEADRKMGWEG